MIDWEFCDIIHQSAIDVHRNDTTAVSLPHSPNLEN